MGQNDLNSLFAAARARNLIYGQNPPIPDAAQNSAQTEIANKIADVNNPGNVPDQNIPQQSSPQAQNIPNNDSVNVNGGVAGDVPYSPIERNLSPEVSDPNYIAPPKRLEQTPEQQKQIDILKGAPQYQEPSKVRKFLGNALSVGGSLAGIATGNRMIPALADRAENYIEHEPYNKQVRAFQSQAGNIGNVVNAQEGQNKNLADVNAKNFQANAELNRAQAEKLRGEALKQNSTTNTVKVSEPYLLLRGRIQAAEQANKLNKGDQVKYKDASGKEGVAFIDQHYNPDTGRIEHHYVDAITNEPVDAVNAIPIGKTIESRQGTGSIPNQIYREGLAGNTDNINNLKKIQADSAQISADAAAKARGIEAPVIASTNRAKNSEAQSGAVEAGYKAQDAAQIHNQGMTNHVMQGINNPLYLNEPLNFAHNPALQQEANQAYTRVTGNNVPQKIESKQKDLLETSNKTVQAVVNMRRILQDPEVQEKLIGPFAGRATSLEGMLGTPIRGLSPEGEQRLGELRNNFNLLKGNEAAVASGGRGIATMMKALDNSVPSEHMSLGVLAGALKAVEDNANRQTISVKTNQFGDLAHSDLVLDPQGHLRPKYKTRGADEIGTYNPKTNAYDYKKVELK